MLRREISLGMFLLNMDTIIKIWLVYNIQLFMSWLSEPEFVTTVFQ